MSAFISFLVDAGVRKSEALGLQWRHVDLDAGTVTIEQQLEPRCGEVAKFGPTKRGKSRVITLSDDTITLY